VDTGREAAEHGESIEEAARRLRYTWFRELMASGQVDAVATAHTLDDQAETVLGKFLRGAWTEGLSGIHPVVCFPQGRILRPLLGATRAQVVAYLTHLNQAWREDSSNRDPTFTRNRLRHELLPVLETWNPRLPEHLAQMALLARDEEAWWQAELARVAPNLILQGRPVRGGGRASGSAAASRELAIDAAQLGALAPALQRRLLRHAASQLGVSLDFPATEALRTFGLSGRAGQRQELPQNLRAERTPRELRLTMREAEATGVPLPEYTVALPGKIAAPPFGLCLRVEVSGSASPGTAKLRQWKAGDRVRLRHSSAPRKVKEVLERLRVTGSDRGVWPVLEVGGRIVWMKGVELEPDPAILVHATWLPSPERVAD
jgi:tRNA(Ile)-lysidine synthase